jgi:ferric-dicitrate binding protein FerR (iron transport regulator)
MGARDAAAWRRFERLATLAGREVPPAPDVSARVLAALARRSPAVGLPPGAWSFATACLAVALVCGWCGGPALSWLSDPLGSWALDLGWGWLA